MEFESIPLHYTILHDPYADVVRKAKMTYLPVDYKDSYGQTALSLLCSSKLVFNTHEALQRMQLLIEKGANPNVHNKDGDSALLVLCKTFWNSDYINKNVPEDFLILLLNAGVDVDSAIDFYKEVDWKDEKKFKLTTSDMYYDFDKEQKIGNKTITWRHQGWTPGHTSEYNFWTTKHYRKEKARETYKILEKAKKNKKT